MEFANGALKHTAQSIQKKKKGILRAFILVHSYL